MQLVLVYIRRVTPVITYSMSGCLHSSRRTYSDPTWPSIYIGSTIQFNYSVGPKGFLPACFCPGSFSFSFFFLFVSDNKLQSVRCDVTIPG